MIISSFYSAVADDIDTILVEEFDDYEFLAASGKLQNWPNKIFEE